MTDRIAELLCIGGPSVREELIELRNKLVSEKGVQMMVLLKAIDNELSNDKRFYSSVRAERELLKSPTLFFPFSTMN